MEFDFIKRWVLDNLLTLFSIFQTWYYYKNNAIKFYKMIQKIKMTIKSVSTAYDNSIIGKYGSILPPMRTDD
jgi:hypothetical protein